MKWDKLLDVKTVDDSQYIVKNKDIVLVVRCKDCRYYLHSTEICKLIDTRLQFYETNNVWSEDSFCSWGERREDET